MCLCESEERNRSQIVRPYIARVGDGGKFASCIKVSDLFVLGSISYACVVKERAVAKRWCGCVMIFSY